MIVTAIITVREGHLLRQRSSGTDTGVDRGQGSGLQLKFRPAVIEPGSTLPLQEQNAEGRLVSTVEAED